MTRYQKETGIRRFDVCANLAARNPEWRDERTAATRAMAQNSMAFYRREVWGRATRDAYAACRHEIHQHRGMPTALPF